MKTAQLFELFQQSTGISIDTRTLEKGQLFFAISGPNFNANQFAEQAIQKGAIAAIVDDEGMAKEHESIFCVENCLDSLQSLAAHYREVLKTQIVVIGGSNGKTTTKELMHSVLSTEKTVFATPGNFNNHIGVPLSLLKMKPEHELAIIEIGANHQGEHRELLQLVKPDFGLITNNGKDHLEGFGSIEGVIEANSEIFEYLREHKKPAFVNADDSVMLSRSHDLERVLYGSENQDNLLVNVQLTERFPFVKVLLSMGSQKEQEIHTQLFGAFQRHNIGAAAVVSAHFGLSLQQIAKGIESYKPANNRSQLIEWEGHEVLLDAYNANPSSLGAMISDFALHPQEHKCVVAGDMLELGSVSQKEHQLILDELKTAKFDLVICVGDEFGQFSEHYPFHFVSTYEEAKKLLQQKSPANSSILIKGSRGLKLEKIVMS